MDRIVTAISIAAAALVASGCASVGSSRPDVLALAVGDPERSAQQIFIPVDSVVDTLNGSVLSPQALREHLGDARLVFVGEQHTSLEDHRVQLRVLELLQEAERPIVIGLEMFETETQPILDAWSAGQLTEAEFVQRSDWYRNWGYHWGYYREILLFARTHAIPLVALRAPG